MTLSDVINRLYATGRYTLERLAQMAECSIATITRVRDDLGDTTFSKGARLSRHLLEDSGDDSVVRLCLADGWYVCRHSDQMPDGCVEKETADTCEAVCDARRAFNAGRDAEALRDLNRAYEMLDSFRKEIEQRINC